MYDHNSVEPKRQKFREEKDIFKFEKDDTKPKFYALDMFPYPSGSGLHVGHPKGYIANDIIARYKVASGFNVLHPMGWDAFGLPAENYAIKTGVHPREVTKQNIDNFKKQIKRIGFSYDRNREIDTTDPNYYKWTQWIFLKMFENGLAYEQDLPINYCPSCKTGLANEEVLNDNTCERCGKEVELKKIRQWVLKITEYADRLLYDVDKLDWPEHIKQMQRNWIGRSEGCQFQMEVISKDGDEYLGQIGVYTTRIDTVFGVTYAVIAADHPKVYEFISNDQFENCEDYINKISNKSEQERIAEGKNKTGVFTGNFVINPFNNDKIPLFISDYVLGNYGTGAVMAVPAHDERDYDFAINNNLHIKAVISDSKDRILSYDNGDLPYIKDGVLVNSGEFNGLTSEQARNELTEYAEKYGFGYRKINYKLRDWLFSRQRYWGEPIPIIHISYENYNKLSKVSSIYETDNKNAYILDKNGEEFLVVNGKEFSKIYDGLYDKLICNYDLPLELPQVEKFEPEGDGLSPLTAVDSFVNVEIADNLKGKRETNTMPQWGGSCWYYLRFMDPNNNEYPVSREISDYWGMVDSYIGGVEHAVLHLLYARFWHKFLYDIGVVGFDEPFYRLANPGTILAYAYKRKNGGLVANDKVIERDGGYFDEDTGEELEKIVSKMSKSLKNVENPDNVIAQYGADVFRLYEMYMGDFRDSAPWDTQGIMGVKRFIDRTWNMFKNGKSAKDDYSSIKLLHKTIKKVGEDIDNYKFNTAIAQLMILLNEGHPVDENKQKERKESFLILLSPFAPHITEELWYDMGNTPSIFNNASWPMYDENMIEESVVNLAVQINGKTRGTIEVRKDASENEVLDIIKNDNKLLKYINEGYKKVIYVPEKIINIIV